MTEAMRTAEKMRRVSKKQAETQIVPINTPANYLSPSVISSISSVKKDKEHFEKIISRTLMDIILNAESPKDKLAAIDRYVKLTQTSQLLIKNGSKTAAIETQSDGPTTLNIDLSSHIKTDEPQEAYEVKSRDLVAEKNAKIFASFSPTSDAEYEVVDD